MPSLSSGDVERLRVAMRLLLSPHDFSSATMWREAVCAHLLSWIHTDSVHMTLSRSVSPSMVGAGRWGGPEMREYAANWHNRQEVDRERERRNLRVWVRDQVVPRTEFRRTRYFQEFCALHGNLDSAGTWHRFPDGEDVVIHFNSTRCDTFEMNGRTHAIISLLHPALVAGATAVRAIGERSRFDLFDATGRAIAVLTLDGRLQHMTPRLAALTSNSAVGAPLRVELARVARETARVLRIASIKTGVAPTHRAIVGGRSLLLTGSLVCEQTLGATPLCVVVVSTDERSPSTSPTRGAVLTERERQVATLVARGERNRDIAAALRISEHTARRHTERVLKKLGVRSRAAVAGTLGHVRDERVEE